MGLEQNIKSIIDTFNTIGTEVTFVSEKLASSSHHEKTEATKKAWMMMKDLASKQKIEMWGAKTPHISSSLEALEEPNMEVSEDSENKNKTAIFVPAGNPGADDAMKHASSYFLSKLDMEKKDEELSNIATTAIKKSVCINCGKIFIGDESYCSACIEISFKYNEIDFNWVSQEAKKLGLDAAYLTEFLNNTNKKDGSGWKEENCFFCGKMVATKSEKSEYVCHDCYDKNQFKNKISSTVDTAHIPVAKEDEYSGKVKPYYDTILKKYSFAPKKQPTTTETVYFGEAIEEADSIKDKKTIKVKKDGTVTDLKAKAKAPKKVVASPVDVGILPLKEPPPISLMFITIGKHDEMFHVKMSEGLSACGKKSKSIVEMSDCDSAMIACYLKKYICVSCLSHKLTKIILEEQHEQFKKI